MVFGGEGIVSDGSKLVRNLLVGDRKLYCVQRAMANVYIYNGERRVADAGGLAK